MLAKLLWASGISERSWRETVVFWTLLVVSMGWDAKVFPTPSTSIFCSLACGLSFTIIVGLELTATRSLRFETANPEADTSTR